VGTGDFYIEDKMDGERMLLHKCGEQVRVTAGGCERATC